MSTRQHWLSDTSSPQECILTCMLWHCLMCLAHMLVATSTCEVLQAAPHARCAWADNARFHLQTVYARQIYRAIDIRWNHRFKV